MNATGWAVRARGLRKSYGGIAAVSGIDLGITPGEVFALLGPNLVLCLTTFRWQNRRDR